MTSAQIRQSFLDFFRSKQHTIVPSSSLMPDSPNLLFTNAGMNQFVPIFLGERKPDVSKWAGAVPGLDTRAADTQKCIRAGGKHNDLDDVGLDTYHHTFFEMLGNWSFGDYFKKEAIEWAWELVVGVWKFPPQRLYATVYKPNPAKGDPSELDQEAWDLWAEKFRSAGLDPQVHIVYGNKKDNFWMMGDTGPCGPCSELHVDLTPAGDTKGSLVNKGDARCIEIWNLVFIQFNANPDGSFSPLPAKHVDTGMGFERVTSIIQGTQGFKDFANAKISNYETDIFRPIFDELEKLSGKKYDSTLSGSGTGFQPVKEHRPEACATVVQSDQEKIDVAFRVIADHIRTLSFAIADGIQPGNNDRNYVLRRILRRAVRYGRTLGFHEPFFFKLVDVLAKTMGDVFPEIRAKQQHVKDALKREEEAFNNTLDAGIEVFESVVQRSSDLIKLCERIQPKVTLLDNLLSLHGKETFEEFRQIVRPDVQFITHETALLNHADFFHFFGRLGVSLKGSAEMLSNSIEPDFFDRKDKDAKFLFWQVLTSLKKDLDNSKSISGTISGRSAFVLYDTYGFPLDLTELMARERGLVVDKAGFDELMDEQKKLARAAQKKQVVEVSNLDIDRPTEFKGYDTLALVTESVGMTGVKGMQTSVLTVATPFYAEMGGQVGDAGTVSASGRVWQIVNTVRVGPIFCHVLSATDQGVEPLNVFGQLVELKVDAGRRHSIERHHTVTHLLHWALHEVVSREASQKGSFVGPDKLTFDFNSAPLTPQQVADIEKLVNERIVENAGVSWSEVPYAEVKSRKDVMQFFGDKYGDVVRVVQVGGSAGQLNGYSMELCGGTHTRATGEIGLFRITGENAIAAGVRRIEAVAGLTAYDAMKLDRELIKTVAGRVSSPVHELEKKIEALLHHQKELEKSLKAAQQREAGNVAGNLKERVFTHNGIPAIIHNVGGVDGDFLQAVADALKGSFKGVIVLGGAANGAVALVAAVTPDFTGKAQAGKIIQAIAPIVGGKGGGKPDNARGGGKDAAKLDEALTKAKSLLG